MILFFLVLLFFMFDMCFSQHFVYQYFLSMFSICILGSRIDVLYVFLYIKVPNPSRHSRAAGLVLASDFQRTPQILNLSCLPSRDLRVQKYNLFHYLQSLFYIFFQILSITSDFQ
jgi:hypothetical protein